LTLVAGRDLTKYVENIEKAGYPAQDDQLERISGWSMVELPECIGVMYSTKSAINIAAVEIDQWKTLNAKCANPLISKRKHYKFI
jgi:hypothetical protein